MGVRGLMSYLLAKQDQCSETVDLVQIARDRGGIEIVVDFYSFEDLFVKKVWKSLALVRGNEYLRILGAEYGSLDAYISKIVTDLKHLGISLVFVVDGVKGASDLEMRFKSDTWRQRQTNDVEKKNEILQVCSGRVPIHELRNEANIRSVLLEVQVMGTLREAGCKIIQLAAGEADLRIMREMRSRQRAFAVLSNDTDFFVFEDCNFIPHDLFDVGNDLGLGQRQVLPNTPRKLLCGVINSRNVRRLLQLPNLESVIELSILAGNDFTKPHLPKGIAYNVGVKDIRNTGSYAEWVRRTHKVDNSTVFKREMQRSRALESAVQYSRKFYTLNEPFDVDESNDPAYVRIVEGIEKGEYSSSLLPMYRAFYSFRTILEDVRICPSAEEMLAPLRSRLYAILLCGGASSVKECGHTQRRDFDEQYTPAVNDDNIPLVTDIKESDMTENLNTFHYIMTHLERNQDHNWMEIYGPKTGFVVYILRYFLNLHWGKCLIITQAEFCALAATVLGPVQESSWQEIPVCPDSRCVTIAAVFQNIYRHAYLYLGTVLHLWHAFPLPKEIFCGSMWAVLYALTKPHMMNGDSRASEWAIREREIILRDKAQIFQDVSKGFF